MHTCQDRDPGSSGERRSGQPKVDVVVPVVCGIPVAVGGAEVVRIVVPGPGGGLPIKIDGALVGGIGVGGAPGGHLDEACAKVGIDAIGSE